MNEVVHNSRRSLGVVVESGGKLQRLRGTKKEYTRFANRQRVGAGVRVTKEKQRSRDEVSSVFVSQSCLALS